MQFLHLEENPSNNIEVVMKYFFKCFAIFIGLTVLLTLGDKFLLQTSLPLSGAILFSAFTSLILTLLFGWIDAVYIHPGLDEH